MDHPVMHDPVAKRAMEVRLARVEGQVRGVRRMIVDDAPCESIALQLSAARKALDRAFYEMVACMIRSGLQTTASARREHAQAVGEILARFG